MYQLLKALSVEVERSEQLRCTGTVNHLLLDEGQNQLLALNTDGLCMTWVLSRRLELQRKRVLLIGAGGSAASIGYELIRSGCSLWIANRTLAHAQALAESLGRFTGAERDIRWSVFDRVREVLRKVEVVINTVAEGCPIGISETRELA